MNLSYRCITYNQSNKNQYIDNVIMLIDKYDI